MSPVVVFCCVVITLELKRFSGLGRTSAAHSKAEMKENRPKSCPLLRLTITTWISLPGVELRGCSLSSHGARFQPGMSSVNWFCAPGGIQVFFLSVCIKVELLFVCVKRWACNCLAFVTQMYGVTAFCIKEQCQVTGSPAPGSTPTLSPLNNRVQKRITAATEGFWMNESCSCFHWPLRCLLLSSLVVQNTITGQSDNQTNNGFCFFIAAWSFGSEHKLSCVNTHKWYKTLKVQMLVQMCAVLTNWSTVYYSDSRLWGVFFTLFHGYVLIPLWCVSPLSVATLQPQPLVFSNMVTSRRCWLIIFTTRMKTDTFDPSWFGSACSADQRTTDVRQTSGKTLRCCCSSMKVTVMSCCAGAHPVILKVRKAFEHNQIQEKISVLWF